MLEHIKHGIKNKKSRHETACQLKELLANLVNNIDTWNKKDSLCQNRH